MAGQHGQGHPSGGGKVAAAILSLLVLAAATWAFEYVRDYPWVPMAAASVVAGATLVGGDRLLSWVQAVVELVIQVLAAAVEWVVRLVRRKAKAALVALVVLALVGTGGGLAWWVVRPEPVPARGCPHPAELRILTSLDGLEPTREVARRYERWTAARNRHDIDCPEVHAFVYAAPTPATATSALARGWRDDGRQDPLRSVGPRPDVWLPDSTVDPLEVRILAERALLASPVRTSSPIASSSIMVATRVPLSGPVARAPTWPQLISALRQSGRPALLTADPRTSSLGLIAASGYLGDAGGRRVPLAEARERVRALVVAAAGTEGESGLLCQWASATTVDSVVLGEDAWRRFLLGGSPGVGCPEGPRLPSDAQVVPTGTPVLDHPFVEFSWSTPKQQTAIDEFRGWLTGSDGRDALAAVGLNPGRPDCAGPDDGNACVPSDLDATLNLYLKAQEPGQVLLAVDASGSMAQRVGPAGATRFQVASQAIGQALGQMGPQDRVGLWIFPTGEGRGHRQLVGIAEGSAAHREETGRALRAVHPAGGTPLYDTVLAGMQAVATPDAGVGLRALVVVTDGRDTTSALAAPAVRQKVHALARAGGVRLFLIATGEASCTGVEGLQDLATAGLGSCFGANPDQLHDTVALLFDSLWKGQ